MHVVVAWERPVLGIDRQNRESPRALPVNQPLRSPQERGIGFQMHRKEFLSTPFSKVVLRL